MIICPLCGQREIGKIGTDQYYCWNCCVELVVSDQAVKVFQIETDGSLTAYGETGEITTNLGVLEG